MEFWEFLIQKEGDRSWLPLESSTVEILEGRYRMVARSSRVNTPVEIRVIHDALYEDPPKRRIQKRANRTNADGLIVVMPFTYLQAGVWRLVCTSDLMADMLGENWAYEVSLQVMSPDLESDGWDGDDDLADAHVTEPATQPGITVPPVLSSSETPEAIAEGEVPPLPTPDAPVAAPDLAPVAEVPEPQVALETATPTADSPEPADSDAVPPEPDTANQETTSEWADLAETSTEADPDSLASERSPEQIWQEAKASSEQVMAELFADLDAMATDESEQASLPPAGVAQANSVTPAPPPTDSPDSAATSSVPPSIQFSQATAQDVWQLHLASSHYVIRQGTTVTLSGQVSGIQPDVEDYDLRWLYLEAVLRSPQTGEELRRFTQALDAACLPCGFALNLDIQGETQTHLFLGDLNLMCRSAPEMAPVTLASQPFSVTADLNNLLNAIANEFSENQDLQPPLAFLEGETVPLNLAFLDLIEHPTPAPTPLQSSGHTILPPKLHDSDPEQSSPATSPPGEVAQPHSRGIDLPFASSNPALTDEPSVLPPKVSEGPPPTPEQAAIPDPSAPPPAMRTSAEATDAAPDLLPPQSQRMLDHSPNRVLSSEAEWALPDDIWHDPIAPVPPAEPAAAPPPEVEPPSPEEAAFRALNLQERFLSRLSSLATDQELSRWLQRIDPVETAPSRAAPFDWDDNLVSTEVVVDDDPDDAVAHPPRPHLYDRRDMANLEEMEELPLLPEDQSIPAPQLRVKQGELTAGEAVMVTVTLANVPSRIYVKLWLYDRQNRARLDGPKWLINFLTDDQGDLEGRSQFMVPFGCREVQFEAVAIEMATQRESRKVTLEREIIPPNLPLSSIDNWDDLNF
jgi:hypothetical protein